MQNTIGACSADRMTQDKIRDAGVIDNFERVRSRISDASCRLSELQNRLVHVLRDSAPQLTGSGENMKAMRACSSFAQDLRNESDMLDNVICVIQDIIDRLDV